MKMDVKEIVYEGVDLIHVAEVGVQRQVLVNVVMNIHVH
jgi:hypothetical protein